MAASGSESIVIFKSVYEADNKDNDVYCETFRSSGFQVTVVPVLDFEFVNLDQFLNKIKNPDDYAGIIFTSPRCVTAFQLSLELDKECCSILERWKSHKHFVVGEKTGKLVENLGLKASGQEAGNADKLSEIITQSQYEKPFLYPIGSLTQKSFKMKLKEKSIDTDDVMVYQTKPHPNLEEDLKNLKPIMKEGVNYFIYFSPSGINFTLPLLKKLEFELNNIKFVAIGPTTEAALLEKGLPVAASSSKPNPSSLLEAVLSLQKK